jgi:hypothetical protein
MPDKENTPATGAENTPAPETTTPPAPAPETTPAADESALGDAGKKALDAERTARKAAEKAAADALAKVQEFEDRDKTEAEKLADRATTAEERATKAETELTKTLVALEKNVPADLRDFLTGSTREELEAKADALLAHLKPNGGTTPPPGSFDGGARQGDTESPRSPSRSRRPRHR